jgi:AcrR family transcriptional regulator
MGPMTEKDTKERILDAAELLFSERGFATSLRAITTEAGANLAAVNYHFGSKEELVRAVFARRADPVNQERLRLLEACEEEAAPAPASLECILRAFIWPALRMAQDPGRGGPVMVRLLGRLYTGSDEQIEALFRERFVTTARRFGEAIRNAQPALTPDAFSWRFLFTIGAMAHTMADQGKLRMISGGACDTGAVETALEQLVAFLAAGLRAECPVTVKGSGS